MRSLPRLRPASSGSLLRFAFLLAIGFVFAAAPAPPARTAPPDAAADADAPAAPQTRPAGPIDPRADALLHRMADLLASAKSFSFEAHSNVDEVLSNGQKVQVAVNQKVAVRRPDGLSSIITGDREDVQFWYDGKRAALYNRRTNTYGVINAPPTIDATLDLLAGKYGLAVPLADLLVKDPYDSLVNRVRAGYDLGPGLVFDDRCEHLAFRQESVDWEIWIAQGGRPLPCKLAITYKESPAYPRYIAFLSNWNLSPELPQSRFTFTPPAGAKEVPFAEVFSARGAARPADDAANNSRPAGGERQ